MKFIYLLRIIALSALCVVQLDSVIAAETVTSVTSATANGSYRDTATVSIQIEFSLAVDVNTTAGTPTLALNSGGVATYAGGTGTTTLDFNYSVGPADASVRLDYTTTAALVLNGGTIKGTVSGTASTLTLPALSFLAGKTIVIDNTRPTLAATMTGSSNTALVLTFNEAMSTAAATTALNYTLSGTAGLTGNPSAAAINSGGTVVTLTVPSMAAIANGTTVIVTASSGITDLAGNPVSLSANTSSFTVPATVVSSVTSATANGSYRQANTISIQVTFNQAVTVDTTSGTPSLALNSGGTALYTSGSGTTTLNFIYTIGTADSASSLDYFSTAALKLNGATILLTAAPNTAANLALPALGVASLTNTRSIVIDSVAPTLISTLTAASNTALVLTFNKPMSNSAASKLNYSLSGSGGLTGTPTAASINNAGTVVTLTVPSMATIPNGKTVVVTASSSVTDVAGNPVNNSVNAATFTVPTTVISAVTSSTASGYYRAPNTISIQLAFSQNVTVDTTLGVPTVALNSGGTAVYSSGSGTASLTFLYTIDPANSSALLEYPSISALLLNGGTILLTAAPNTTATLTLPAPGSANSLSSSRTIVIDNTTPRLASGLTVPGNTTLMLTFDKPLARTPATVGTNYALGGTSGMRGNPTAVSLDATGTIVTLTVPTMLAIADGKTIVVTVSSSVTDLALNPVNTAYNSASISLNRAPTGLTFAPVSNVKGAIAVTSAAVTIRGINIPAPVSVDPGSDSSLKCATLVSGSTSFGTFGPCSTILVSAGDQIKAQLTSSAFSLSPVVGTISIGGVSAGFTVTTSLATTTPSIVSVAAVSNLSSIINNPDSSLYLSSNGVVIVPGSIANPIVLSYLPVPNTAFSIANNATATFSLSGVRQTFTAVGGNTLVLTKSFTVDSYPGLQALEISSGRAIVSGSLDLAPVASLLLGTGTTRQLAVMPAGTVAPIVDIMRNVDGTGSIAVTAGKVNIRPATASTILLTDTGVTLYANEVAAVDATGKITKIRVGSQDGKAGLVGDPLPASNFPINFIAKANVPKLDVIQERADATKILVRSLFDFAGPRANVAQSYQDPSGLITFNIDNDSVYLLPIWEVTINTSLVDGAVLTDSGYFVVNRNGLSVQMIPMIVDLFPLAASLAASGGSVLINSNGVLEIDLNGNTLMIQPNLVKSPAVAGEPSGLSYDTANRYWKFVHNGFKQIFFPRFYDMSQVAATFKNLDGSMALRDNLNGTITATIKGASYTFAPEFEVLSALGGVPAEHRNDSWWLASNGTIYLKYANGSAQGFRPR